MCDEQEDIDSAAEAHQQQLEAERWGKDMRSLETHLLRDWFGECRTADERLAADQRQARTDRNQNGLSGAHREPAGSARRLPPTGATSTDFGAADAGETETSAI